MKKIVVGLLVFSMILSFACIADESDNIMLTNGMYIVGKDIEPGSYDFSVVGSEGVKSFLSTISLFANIDDYLMVKDSDEKMIANFVVDYRIPKGHATLLEGMVVGVTLYNCQGVIITKE